MMDASFQQELPALEDVWVALDLETTGLSPESDEIIEVGAVKFRGNETLGTFESFVNPNRGLSEFVKRFTGISQADVDAAGPISSVAAALQEFIGTAPLVGHNVAFDLRFLAGNGLQLSNSRADTWDLAYVLLPGSRDYSLAKLAASLGINHPRPHRAIPDATVTREVFLKMRERAADLDVYTLAEMQQLAVKSSWVLAYLLRSLTMEKIAAQIDAPSPTKTSQATSTNRFAVGGIDLTPLKGRLRHAGALRSGDTTHRVDADYVAEILRRGGPLSAVMPGFEERQEQIAMARAVATAVNEGGRLTVEAGTGVGKSLAYLLPAALYALKNNKRVVVSTNTINLQDQLVAKDVPALVSALNTAEPGLGDQLRFCQLKGRANFLCLNRWLLLRSGDSLSEDEARLLAKVTVWLQETATGDRSELNLGRRSSAQPWGRLSADGAPGCQGVNGVCLLRAARDRAAASHLVIVNHALMMSNVMAGGTLIPDHDVLIVDEAHHLEEEATRHLGFDLSHGSVDDYLQSLTGDRGLLNQLAAAFRGSTAAAGRQSTTEEVSARIASILPGIRDSVAALFATLRVMTAPDDRDRNNGLEERVTAATRSQPDWSDLEILWERVDTALGELRGEMSGLSTALEGLEQAGIPNYDGLLMEASDRRQRITEVRDELSEFVAHPKDDGIYWVTDDGRSGDLSMHAAPLHVGEHLSKLLFADKESVILTSATLATDGTFEHIRERTGFDDTNDLLVGSPFDYPNAAMLCVPEDMPEPQSWAYQAAVEQAVIDAALAAGGRTMALFTSHAALQATAGGIRASLLARGLTVLAQGIDGRPHQIVEGLLDDPESVVLGTASFWEGVDLPGDALKVLLLARLPFGVPTAPVFAARSEQFEDPFTEYAVPQAILRLRQGFGRLIRTKTDRGAVVILDRRIVSRRYGKTFLDSLPPTQFKTPRLHQLSDELRAWL